MPDLTDHLRQLRPEIDHARAKEHFEASLRTRRRHRFGYLVGASCAVLLIVAAAVTLAARDADEQGGVIAGEPNSEAAGHRVAAVDDRLLPPGTPIAPGIDVQPGSSLVASTFPLIDSYPEETTDQTPIGWQALLVINGDPVDVWNSYASALDLQEADARSTCVVTTLPKPEAPSTPTPNTTEVVDQQRHPERFLTEPRLDGENRLDCNITTPAVSMVMSVGSAICRMDEKATCPLVPVAHLRVAVTNNPEPSDYEQRGTDQLRYERAIQVTDQSAVPELVAIPEGPVIPPTLDAGGESRLPTEGERFDGELDYFLDRTDVAFIPSGGRSLVAPAMLLPCNSGLVAVLEVPGSPAEVVDAFDRADDFDDPLTLSTGQDVEGRSWAGGLISTAGGYYVDFVALDTGDGTTAVTITECGD